MRVRCAIPEQGSVDAMVVEHEMLLTPVEERLGMASRAAGRAMTVVAWLSQVKLEAEAGKQD